MKSLTFILVQILMASSSLNSDKNVLSSNQKEYESISTTTSSINQTRTDLYPINDSSNYNWHSNLLDLYQDIKLWRDLFIFFGSAITGIGTMLNMFCIIIFYKSKLFRNSSFPYYVYIISIVDTLNILIRFFIPQLIEQTVRSILVNRYHVDSYEFDSEKYDKYTSYIASDYHCSIFIYFYNSLTLTSVWLMCAVSLERWLVIQFALQTKYMIKLRAFLILILIFLITFSFNVFDLAPGLYIKPQWYANLTLLCERDDTYNTENNTVRIYKRLGSFSFNTETFAFVRTLLQTVVPFLVVLCFNSLIIYNFKQIKLNAFGYGHTKSNSCVSVFSGGSYTSNFIGAHSRSNSLKGRNRKRSKRTNKQKQEDHQNIANNSFDYKGVGKDLYFLNNSSRSPSPLLTRSNTPATPTNPDQQVTSLVSALNLAGNNKIRTSSPSPHLPNDSKSIASNSSGACGDTGTGNNAAKLSPSKLFDSSYLMPPTHSSFRHQQQQQRLEMSYKSGSPSIGTTNSSANLSVAGSSNLTATTNLYQTNHISFCLNSSNNNTAANLLEKVENSPEYNMVETDLDTTQNSNKLSITVNPIMDHPKSLLTASNTPTKSSYKRRAFKVKINRETDIMLIVLSFSILLSQLPCTIAYYLIYYCNILKLRDDVTNVYLAARIPIILYIIRLLEMVYFSLNFFFYITLSPSLRKEIKSYSSKESICDFFNKNFRNSRLVIAVFGPPSLKNDAKKTNNLNSNRTIFDKEKTVLKHIDSNSMNNSILDADNVYSKSPSKYDNISVPITNTNTNSANFFLGSSNDLAHSSNNNRLNSNSSGEYYEFIQKLRSISPLRKSNFFLNDSARLNTPQIRITDVELNEHYEAKKVKNNSKKNLRLFPKKNRMKKSDKEGKLLKRQDANIQIIIDNVNDEENIVIDGSYSDIGGNS